MSATAALKLRDIEVFVVEVHLARLSPHRDGIRKVLRECKVPVRSSHPKKAVERCTVCARSACAALEVRQQCAWRLKGVRAPIREWTAKRRGSLMHNFLPVAPEIGQGAEIEIALVAAESAFIVFGHDCAIVATL